MPINQITVQLKYRTQSSSFIEGQDVALTQSLADSDADPDLLHPDVLLDLVDQLPQGHRLLQPLDPPHALTLDRELLKLDHPHRPRLGEVADEAEDLDELALGAVDDEAAVGVVEGHAAAGEGHEGGEGGAVVEGEEAVHGDGVGVAVRVGGVETLGQDGDCAYATCEMGEKYNW